MKRNYCTLGDSKYLPHLKCLIESMLEHFSGDYTIHVLAMDKKVESHLKSKNYDKVRVCSLDEVQEDFDLKAIRFLPPGREAISNASSSGKDPGFVQFCWAMAPVFSKWILERVRESVTYVDADILFFKDIQGFFDELGNSSIGLVSHRIPYLYTSGEYNVGVVHFENDGPGRAALSLWCRVMKDPQNPYAVGFGTCGDQKYLELIEAIFRDNTRVVDKNFGHLAPWNVTLHKYQSDKIVWKNVAQDLVYFHFAHFVMHDDSSYRASYKNEWIWGDPLSTCDFVKSKYDVYNSKMKVAKSEVI
jgi:hypothetical protein